MARGYDVVHRGCRRFAVLLAVLGLNACVVLPPVFESRYTDTKQLQFRLGMTRAEVHRLVGKPYRVIGATNELFELIDYDGYLAFFFGLPMAGGAAGVARLNSETYRLLLRYQNDALQRIEQFGPYGKVATNPAVVSLNQPLSDHLLPQIREHPLSLSGASDTPLLWLSPDGGEALALYPDGRVRRQLQDGRVVTEIWPVCVGKNLLVSLFNMEFFGCRGLVSANATRLVVIRESDRGDHNGRLLVLDRASGEVLGEYTGHGLGNLWQGPGARLVTTTSNGLVASAGRDGDIHLWDPVTLKALRAVSMPASKNFFSPLLITSIAASADGQLLAASDQENRAALWRVDDGKLLYWCTRDCVKVAFRDSSKTFEITSGTHVERWHLDPDSDTPLQALAESWLLPADDYQNAFVGSGTSDFNMRSMTVHDVQQGQNSLRVSTLPNQLMVHDAIRDRSGVLTVADLQRLAKQPLSESDADSACERPCQFAQAVSHPSAGRLLVASGLKVYELDFGHFDEQKVLDIAATPR